MNKSTLNPPAILIIINPVEKPKASITATEESEGAIFFRRIYDIAKTAKIEVPNAVINGCMPRKSPKAIPPNAVCASPSPSIASFLRIKNRPTIPQTAATIMPPIRAF